MPGPRKDKSSIVSSEIKKNMRLNQFIAHAGICSRRKADDLILGGEISVNGEKVRSLGQKIDPKDQVYYQGKLIQAQKKVYILLNKPKDFITTTDDPQERKTVMELIKNATNERIYPVGRLDRNTTGLLLFTNDGDLAGKLAHPSGNIQKLYHVTLNKTLKPGDLLKIKEGLELEDGIILVDAISYVEGASHNEVGVQIHSGKNRIVRRIFESLGYEIEKLDRSMYAGLTKKDLSKGKWRNLTAKELIEMDKLIKESSKPIRPAKTTNTFKLEQNLESKKSDTISKSEKSEIAPEFSKVEKLSISTINVRARKSNALPKFPRPEKFPKPEILSKPEILPKPEKFPKPEILPKFIKLKKSIKPS